RALIAHADSNGLVVAAGGRLRQWRVGIDRARGPRCEPGWTLSDVIGAPLHTPFADAAGVLYLTTQRSDPPATLVSAVPPATGETLWQRTLGFAPSSPYLALGGAVVTVDPRGAVIAIEPAAPAETPGGWRLGGRELAGAIAGVAARAAVVRAADGAFEVFVPT